MWARYLIAAIAFVLYTIWAVETLLLIVAQCGRGGKKAVWWAGIPIGLFKEVLLNQLEEPDSGLSSL